VVVFVKCIPLFAVLACRLLRLFGGMPSNRWDTSVIRIKRSRFVVADFCCSKQNISNEGLPENKRRAKFK
jgi:hypothetical protein